MSRRKILASVAATTAGLSAPARADASGPVAPQPFFASVKRAVAALAAVGQPVRAEDAAQLEALAGRGDAGAVAAAEAILAKYVIVDVALGADGYARTTVGGAPRRLTEAGWTAFLVRVSNPAGLTARLRVTGTYESVSMPSTGASRPGLMDRPDMVGPTAETWHRAELYQLPPIGPTLSGAPVDYQLIQIFSRDRGAREMDIDFWAASEPLAGVHAHYAYRGAHLSFDCAPSRDIVLRIRDADGRGCMASLIIKDGLNRVYPLQAMRLEPDMYFQPQIYRADGETVRLPDGEYVVEARRGPEYLVGRQTVVLGAGQDEIRVQLERWIDPARWGWWSGDTHIHGAGCSHYEHPTEGVTPATMIRHVRGEGLSIGDVLSWGPGWYDQKRFFTGRAVSPPAGLEHPKLQAANNATWIPKPTAEDQESTLRYDVEVSGFPSSHCGHLVLLRLKDQDYPGTTVIEDWPSWNLPILQWARAQGAVVGYAHCGLGMEVRSPDLPNWEIPPMDGIGTQEAIVDVTHGAVDFLSGTNTRPAAELNAWYHLLNCGFRLAMLGETDYPCLSGERPGVGRSYVKLDARPVGDAGYEAWIRSLAAGRLYCGDGRSHFLDWSVAGRRSGEADVRLAAPGVVAVKALVAARLEETPRANQPSPPATPDLAPEFGWNIEAARIGQSRDVAVELIVNGKAVAQQRLHADGRPQALTFQAAIARSAWAALRILPSAHTHPVFIEVAGQPIRASRRSAQWCRQCVDKLWAVKSPQMRDSERPAAAAAYDHARQIYDRIIGESDVA